MKLVDELSSSSRGSDWLRVLPVECVEALNTIDHHLSNYWDTDECVPSKSVTLSPFHMIAPTEIKMLIICKEPYSSKWMSTGVPVEVKWHKIPVTPSESAFGNLIRNYWGNIDRNNFMRCYYASGVMVINAAFTVSATLDKRYSLARSHFPLWSRFCYPFVRFLNSHNIPILALGVEAKGLLRDLIINTNTRYCTYPTDTITIRDFCSVANEMMQSAVFV